LATAAIHRASRVPQVVGTQRRQPGRPDRWQPHLDPEVGRSRLYDAIERRGTFDATGSQRDWFV
jgi:hypothetical protein